MQDLSNLVQMLALFIGAISTFWATTHKAHKTDYSEIIQELKSERDEYKKRCRALQKELDNAKEEILKLKTMKMEVSSRNEHK